MVEKVLAYREQKKEEEKVILGGQFGPKKLLLFIVLLYLTITVEYQVFGLMLKIILTYTTVKYAL